MAINKAAVLKRGDMKAMSRQIAQEAAQLTAEKLQGDTSDEDIMGVEEDLEEKRVQSREEIAREVADKDSFDIFVDVGDVRYNEGDTVLYTVQRNDAWLGQKKHPYSWNELQKEYGGGRYKILCRSGVTNKFLRAQSKSIDDSLNPSQKQAQTSDVSRDLLETMRQENERRDRELREERERLNQEKERVRMEARQEGQANTTLLSTLISGILSKPKDTSDVDLIKAELKNEIQNSNNQMANVLTLMASKMDSQPKEDGSVKMTEMMLKMQEMNMNMMRELREDSLRQAKEIREDMNKMMDKLSTQMNTKKEDFGAMELLKLVREAEESGMEKMQMVRELAKEMKEQDSGDDDKPEKDESLLNTFLKTTIPVFGNMMMQNKNAEAQAPALPAPRRLVQQQVTQRNTDVQTQATGRTENSNNQQGIQTSRTNVGKNSVGMPTATIDETPSPEAQAEQRAKAKDYVIEQIQPLVVEHLVATKSPLECGKACVHKLVDLNVHPVMATELFNEADIVGLAAKHGLTDEAYNGIEGWLKEFYACIVSEARIFVDSHSAQVVQG